MDEDEEEFTLLGAEDTPAYFQDPFREVVSAMEEDEEEMIKTQLPQMPTHCPAPNVTYNGSLLSGPGESRSRSWSGVEAVAFKAVRDVEFEVRVGPFPSDMQRCKLTCVDGQWVGPLCRNSEDEEYAALLKSCELNLHPAHILITYRYQELKLRESTLFPDGSSVEFRCQEDSDFPGHDFALEGNSTLTCHDGRWDSRIPFCRPTTSRTNYSEDAPPRLGVHVPSGHSSVGPAGELLVYPGSIVHLDCLFNRKHGNPEWKIDKEDKDYATGWVIDENDRDWQYRLSLFYVKDEDTNTFTCKTPRGKTNSIRIVVTDMQCPEFDISDVELESRLEGRKIGDKVFFSCPQGFDLVGKNSLKCLRNGLWSAGAPHCQPVRCTALEILDAHLRVLSLNNSFQGKATFLCPFGYRLVGPDAITCGPQGQWTGFVPKCKAISCPPPLPPLNGKLLDNGHYLVGNTVQYLCDEGFVLIGEPIIRCTESGLWSHAPPFCKRACRFPGDPAHGRVTPVKFLYEVGDRILIQCDAGHVNMGRQKLQCNQNGAWSDRMPTCLSYRN